MHFIQPFVLLGDDFYEWLVKKDFLEQNTAICILNCVVIRMGIPSGEQLEYKQVGFHLT